MEKWFKQGAWNLLCLQTGVCLPPARSRESVCKSHKLLFTWVQKHFLSARAATVSRNLKIMGKQKKTKNGKSVMNVLSAFYIFCCCCCNKVHP